MKNKRMLIFALTCANAVTMVDMVGIVPAFGDISMAFADKDPTLVNMVLTIPTLFMVIFAVIAGRLSLVVSKKTLLCLGIIVFTIGGTLPFLSSDLTTILVLRALCGAGAGFVLPTYSSLISDFFSGFERVRVLGLSNASGNIILIIVSLIGGFIAVFDWHNVFFVYLVGIALLLLALLNIPKTTPDGMRMKAPDADKPKDSAPAASVTKPTFLLALICFVSLSFLFICSVLGSPYIMMEGIGDSAFLGICSTMMIITQIIIGFLFSPFIKFFKRYALTIGLAIYAFGYFLFANIHSQPGAIVFFLVLGLAIGITIPYLITSATALGIKVPSRQTFIISIVTGGMFIGQFCSVFAIALIEAAAKPANTRELFMTVAFLAVGFVVINIINNIVKRNKPFELASTLEGPPIEAIEEG